MFKGLEHTGIASPDPERLAQWYVDCLEFTVNYRYDGNVFVKAANGTVLEIIPSEGGALPRPMKEIGLRHLAIEVDDFDSACQVLKARGVKFVTAPANLQGNRLVFFLDGDGNYVHLIQRERPLP